MPGVLQIVALIKCCMRQSEWIWSQPLMVRLLTAADGVVHAGKFARGQHSVNTRGGYCWGTVLKGSPYAFSSAVLYVLGTETVHLSWTLFNNVRIANSLGDKDSVSLQTLGKISSQLWMIKIGQAS